MEISQRETTFDCSDSLDKWCQYKYCGVLAPQLPDAPADLTANVVSSSQIDLNWTDTTGNEDGFMIEQKTTDQFNVIGTVEANVTSFSSMDLSELTAYSYRVRAFNVSGYSDYTNEITATTDSNNTTSSTVPEANSNNVLNIYPNPFQETTHIAYTVLRDCFVSMKVFDSSGRALITLVHEFKQAGQFTTTLNARDLPDGAYYCRMCAGKMVETKKMVLLR